MHVVENLMVEKQILQTEPDQQTVREEQPSKHQLFKTPSLEYFEIYGVKRNIARC